MSQTYDDCIQLFCVRCKDVGLDCACTVYGINEEIVVYSTILHMLEYHAIFEYMMGICFIIRKITDYLDDKKKILDLLSSYNKNSNFVQDMIIDL